MRDPVIEALDRREAEEQRWLDSLPKCCDCGEPIQDDYLYDICGDIYCEECIRNFREYTEGYIND